MRRPYSVQIELAEGCNRICAFCGLNGIRDKVGGYQFMEKSTAEAAAKGFASLCPNARYEFAMHGEPLMNPKHLDILRIFRKWLPEAQFLLATNGRAMLGGKMQGHVIALFEAGVDIVMLDTYNPERDQLQEAAKALKGVDVMDFYEDCIPRKFSPYFNHRRKVQGTLIIMDDIGERSGESSSRTIMNHAGNTNYKPLPEEPLAKTCTIPFREMSVCYDGDVNICCMDWGHEMTCGNVNEAPASAIWEGAIFRAARKVLGQRSRGFSPCDRCDASSGSRSGLLPKLPAPTKEDLALLRGVVEEQSGRNYPKLKQYWDIDGSTCSLPDEWPGEGKM
tara:strand:+ start:90 stop:1094 length:1005 start_codon:yes stop_codon:yes gene_type:complete